MIRLKDIINEGISNSPNFKKWFSGSKIVDEKGNPLLMYHATGASFEKFEHSKTGGVGFYFTSDPEEANVYADFRRGESPNIMPVYLSIKNPATPEIELSVAKEFQGRLGGNPRLAINRILQQRGYDGIKRGTHVIAFEPNQIKSATGNTGDFNQQNPDIVKETIESRKPPTIKLKDIIKSILSETFDLYARNKSVDFSVNNFEWRAILTLIEQANDTYNLNLPDFYLWGTNDGAGLPTQKQCNQLADAIEALIGDKPHNVKITKPLPHPEFAGFESESDIGTIREFIQFLRKCNGFEIW